jgi:murein L,D-transpeptidase YafK
MKSNRLIQFNQACLALSLTFSAWQVSADTSSDFKAPTAQAENLLVDALKHMQTLDMGQALTVVQELSQMHPDYRLAQMMKADLLAMQAGNFGLLESVRQAYPRSVKRYQQEAEVRWQYAHSDENSHHLYLNDSVLKIGHQKHLVLVNLAKSRLYLYENRLGELALLANYYISMGTAGSGKQREGDRKTPIGVYHITDWVPGEQLADLYGVGALPLNYPNIWDQALGRTGHGIWLHGTPSDTFSRPPQSSQGCVVLNNQEMQSLVSQFNVGLATPVIILDSSKDMVRMEEERLAVLTEVHAWLVDQGQDVDWSKVSVYRYPNEDGLYYATFPDKDSSDHMSHQYWRRDHDGGWQLVLQTKDPVFIRTRLS